jgi:hypothetical protein
MLLSAVDGSVGADTSIVKEFCENDGAELERTTWKKAAADMGELAQGQHDYIMELKSKERVM